MCTFNAKIEGDGEEIKEKRRVWQVKQKREARCPIGTSAILHGPFNTIIYRFT